MIVLKRVMVSPYSEYARKLVTRWLSMRQNWLLVGWACMKIGYSLAEHARKLVTRQASIRKNHFGAPHVFSEFFPVPPITRSSVRFSRPSLTSPVWCLCLFSHPMSPVLCLCCLYPVLCPLSHVSVLCLPSAVPSLTSMLFVSRPLSPVTRDLSLVSHPLFTVP
jgi:hypothetical protein